MYGTFKNENVYVSFIFILVEKKNNNFILEYYMIFINLKKLYPNTIKSNCKILIIVDDSKSRE